MVDWSWRSRPGTFLAQVRRVRCLWPQQSRIRGARGGCAVGHGLEGSAVGDCFGLSQVVAPGVPRALPLCGFQGLGVRRGADLLGVPNPGEDVAPTRVLEEGLFKPPSFIDVPAWVRFYRLCL